MCMFGCVHISKCDSVPRKKHHQHKLQWVMTTINASRVFVLIDRKKHQYKFHSYKIILGTSIGVGGSKSCIKMVLTLYI